MFGLTEQEMDAYRNLVQDYAIQDVTPAIIGNSQFIAPIIEQEGKQVPDKEHVNKVITDIETIITLVASHMAYDYANLQSESKLVEVEIVHELHTKYDSVLITQFIKYGVAFSSGVISDILTELMLELPYLYMAAIQDENFDDDQFLTERLEAYEKYLEDNFSEEGDFEEE